MYINSLNSFEDMLCLSLIGRKKKASWSPHYHLLGKPCLEPSGCYRHELVPQGAGGQRWRRHSWAWPIQGVLWNTIFIAESKAGFLITPGTKGKEAGDQIWRSLRTSVWATFFFSETGHWHVLRRICSLVYWRPRVPAGTTGTMWNPYKPERSCVCMVCEVVREWGKGEEEFQRKIPGPLWLSSAWTVVLKGTVSLQCSLQSSRQLQNAQQAANTSERGSPNPSVRKTEDRACNTHLIGWRSLK